ncbi:MAG: magnesium transporter, partial [Candidatus Methanomethylophilaceae archaeon]
MRPVNTTNGFFIRNRSVFVMGLLALIIAATADLFAGIFLTTMEDYILLIPGMMILIYSAIGMRGNIFGAMGSRLGTSMHMGTFQMSFKKGGVLRSNIESAMALTMAISFAMGLVGWVVVELIFGGGINIISFIFISLMGGLLAGLVVVAFNIIIAHEGFKRNWNVDDITAPLIAAAGDIVTVPMIFLATWMVLSFDQMLIYILCIFLIILTSIVMISVLLRKTKRKGRKDEAKRIVIQSTPVLIACLFLEIGAGMIIETQTEQMIQYAVLLVLLPAFLNEGNALSGMLTSRLSSMLHLGTLESQSTPPKEASENFEIIYILALVTFAFIGIAAFALHPYDLGFTTVMIIILLSGFLATTVINFLSYYVAIAAIKFNL